MTAAAAQDREAQERVQRVAQALQALLPEAAGNQDCFCGICLSTSDAAEAAIAALAPDFADAEKRGRAAGARDALLDAAFDLDIPNTKPHTREDMIGAAGAPEWLRARAGQLERVGRLGAPRQEETS